MQKYRLETRGRPQIRGCDIAQPNENSNRLQSQFTDTEIYALGYCGYSTAVFVLLHAGLIKQEAVGRSRNTPDPIRKYYGWALKAVAA